MSSRRRARVGVALVGALIAPAGALDAQVPDPCEPLQPIASSLLSSHYRFAMGPTSAMPDACGLAELLPVASPFGLAVSGTGHLQYDLRVVGHGLSDLDSPDTRYVVWLATPALDRIQPLGPLGPDAELRARVDWNKILLVVSREPADVVPGDRWSGPVVLLGRSRSALLQSLMGHSIFNRAEFE